MDLVSIIIIIRQRVVRMYSLDCNGLSIIIHVYACKKYRVQLHYCWSVMHFISARKQVLRVQFQYCCNDYDFIYTYNGL